MSGPDGRATVMPLRTTEEAEADMLKRARPRYLARLDDRWTALNTAGDEVIDGRTDTKEELMDELGLCPGSVRRHEPGLYEIDHETVPANIKNRITSLRS